MRGRNYQNAVLTVIAGLLAVHAVDRQIGIASPATAEAQVGGQEGALSNALEQRKQMISELRQLSSKMDRLEARLNGGINVKVTDMPPIRLPPDTRGAQAPKQSERPLAEVSSDFEIGR
jgi:hypothetical protein